MNIHIKKQMNLLPFLTIALLTVSVVFVTLYTTKTCPGQPQYQTFQTSLTEADRNTNTLSYPIPNGTQKIEVSFPGVSYSAFDGFGTFTFNAYTYIPGDHPQNLSANPSVYTENTDIIGSNFWSQIYSQKFPGNYSNDVTTNTYFSEFRANNSQNWGSISSLTTFSFLFANSFSGNASVTVYWELD